MKVFRLIFLVCLAGAGAAGATDDVFDRVQDALTWSAAGDQVRARVSGTFDAEEYDVRAPVPGLVQTTGHDLFSPRLSVFLDAQFGAQFYFFAQGRADRGFDPTEDERQARLDEYAIRFTPWNDGRLNIQLGKFATVVGTWTARHGSWANPFITAPLPYENLTGIWDSEAVRSSNMLLQWSHVRPGLPPGMTAREKYLRVPIIWGPSYATGVAISGEVRRLLYALELKHASLSSRPEAWSRIRGQTDHPTVSGRVGYRLNEMWNVGLSASAGSYLRPLAVRTLAPGHGLGDYRQLVIAQDASFAWHHVQVWTEVYAARFEIPLVGNADTLAYYAEAKYKFTPQFFGALRWNQQLFATIPDRAGPTRWGRDVWRIDVAPGYRFTSHTQLKLQYSLQDGDAGSRRYNRILAAQLTLRF